MIVEITDNQSRPVDQALLAAAARAAQELGAASLPGTPRPLDEISIVLLDDEAMTALNRQLLGRDDATDVIAFEAEDDPDARRSEIYVNTDAAARQGPEYGHDFAWELCFLVAHGLLHALGYADATDTDRRRMFSLQHAVLAGLGLGDEGDTGIGRRSDTS